MWPDPEAGAEPPALTDIVETLRTSERGQAASLITGSLNVFDAPTRWAFLKLITGGFRVGVSARLAKTALRHTSGLIGTKESDFRFRIVRCHASLCYAHRHPFYTARRAGR